MKFSQLIECNMRNIFLEKSYTECDGEISPRLFSEKWKLSISLDQLSKIFYSFVFIVSQVEDYRNILELSWAHLLSYYALCSINWSNFIAWLSLLCETLGDMFIGIVRKPGCDVMNFEVKLIFLIKLNFLHDQNVVKKT